MVLLEVNVDDATGETLAHAIGALLDAGAHDAWVTPIVMKKGRPAYTVSVLVDPPLAAQVAAVLTRETGSLGVRGRTLERWPVAATEQVDVAGYPVRVKVGAGRVKVEHDDAARVARRTGRSAARWWPPPRTRGVDGGRSRRRRWRRSTVAAVRRRRASTPT